MGFTSQQPLGFLPQFLKNLWVPQFGTTSISRWRSLFQTMERPARAASFSCNDTCCHGRKDGTRSDDQRFYGEYDLLCWRILYIYGQSMVNICFSYHSGWRIFAQPTSRIWWSLKLAIPNDLTKAVGYLVSPNAAHRGYSQFHKARWRLWGVSQYIQILQITRPGKR